MKAITSPDTAALLQQHLDARESSQRLRAVLAAGTHPDPRHVPVLIERCAVEPDFYVRDMLTWALTRHPSSSTVPLLLDEVTSPIAAQARSQALHTLSKIGDPAAWSAITAELLGDDDDEVARSAWRAAVVLVPLDEAPALARQLIEQLGRGGRDTQLSLSRALAALGEEARVAVARAAERSVDETVVAHALATERLLDDPEESFDAALFDARRIIALGPHADR